MRLFSIIGIYLSLSCIGSDLKRLYVRPHNDHTVNEFGIQHHFPNGVISIEVNSDEHRDLSKNKNIDILEYASQWELTKHVKPCQPWPSCKNEPSPPTEGRVYFPNDQTPWGIEEVYADPLLTLTTGGSGVTVAVLDTGANTGHLDITRRVSQCKDFTKRKR